MPHGCLITQILIEEKNIKYYIDIDLGTSAVKLPVLSETGEIRKTVSESYPVSYPRTGWSEQDPEALDGAI